MDKDDTYYNFTYCNTTNLGQYIVSGIGDLDGVRTSWTYDFEVTGTGFEFTESRSSYYLGLLALLVFFLIGNIYLITRVPSGNDTDRIKGG